LVALGWAAGLGGVVYAYKYFTDDMLSLSVRWKIVAARRHVAEGNVGAAIEQYTLATQELAEHDRVRVFLHDAIANLAYDARDYATAAEHYTTTIKGLIHNGYAPVHPAIIEISLKLATCFHKSGRTSDVETGLLWCINSCQEQVAKEEEALQDWRVLLGMSLEQLGAFYLTEHEPSV
jgi:hypothetical protein